MGIALSIFFSKLAPENFQVSDTLLKKEDIRL